MVTHYKKRESINYTLFLYLLQLEDTLWAGLTDLHIKTPMGITAENLAEKYHITREECDQFAYQTQQRWKAGQYASLAIFNKAALNSQLGLSILQSTVFVSIILYCL